MIKTRRQMKKDIMPALKLTIVFIIICAVIYPLIIAAVGLLSPGGGKGETVTLHGRIVGYANIGQRFDQDKYFWSRPSAVAYNAAGSGGSNKGPSNPDYLRDVEAHIDTFLRHNPDITKAEIPAELVTYSGSGLDPDLSPDGAYVQVARIAKVRHASEGEIRSLIERHLEKPLFNLFGPQKVNVLQLNIALDSLE
jgi:potassium-transporting ATPase KdpC subunit